MGRSRELAELAASYDSGNLFGMKNRIINGAMVIDQRNAGASVTPTNGQFTLDRWKARASQSGKYTVQQNAGSVTPPVGFSNYLGITSTSAYSIGSTDYFFLEYDIEGSNWSDLAWGTVNAIPITLSFWVRSSLTGTFGGALRNYQSSSNGCYAFSYTINSANTWEFKTVTITGAGTNTSNWVSTTAGALELDFAFGIGSTFSGSGGSWTTTNTISTTGATSVVGTNGATFYITGVQLEKGSTATSFDFRSYGTELALCQRYFYMAASGAILSTAYVCNAYNWGTLQIQGTVPFPVNMRANPTLYASSGTNYYADDLPVIRTFNGLTIYAPTTTMASVYSAISSGTAGVATAIRLNNASAYVGFTAEL